MEELLSLDISEELTDLQHLLEYALVVAESSLMESEYKSLGLLELLQESESTTLKEYNEIRVELLQRFNILRKLKREGREKLYASKLLGQDKIDLIVGYINRLSEIRDKEISKTNQKEMATRVISASKALINNLVEEYNIVAKKLGKPLRVVVF